jgi:hypothetical protein
LGQIDNLSARIHELAARLDASPPVKVCVIEIPDGWDTDRVLARHYEAKPEDARSPLKIFLRRFGSAEEIRQDALKAPENYPGANCDHESWRSLALEELAAGRDPMVTLRDPSLGGNLVSN